MSLSAWNFHVLCSDEAGGRIYFVVAIAIDVAVVSNKTFHSNRARIKWDLIFSWILNIYCCYNDL